MADLDMSSQNSACETWYGVTVSLTPYTISPFEPAISSGTGIQNESVFHLCDLFTSFTLTQPSAAVAAFGARSRAYITMAMAIYLLSNNLVDPYSPYIHRGIFETLDSVFADIPARHLRALLQSRLANVRAAFEALLNISGVLKQPLAFKFLVEIGTGNNWLSISARGHEYLYHAVCMDLDEVVQQLLERGCHPDKPVGTGHDVEDPTTPIITALERRNIRCLQLLLKHCDVNSNSQFDAHSNHQFRWLLYGYTSFTFFIQRTYDFDEMLFGQGIKLFLDAGADINSLLKNTRVYGGIPGLPHLWWAHHRIWSVLDCLFCFHPRLFYKFAPNWSPAEASQPTRAGILMTLEFGPNMLSEHCNKLAQNVGWARLYEYLELLVAELLTGIGPWFPCSRRMVNLKTADALVNLGVSMDKVLSRAPSLLTDYLDFWVTKTYRDCDMEVIQYLLNNGAIVDNRALQQAVRWQNTGLLSLLVQNTVDLQRQGASAVLEAATASNFEAVKILLDAGVDVNTDFARDPMKYGQLFGRTVWELASLLCQVFELWALPFEELNNMVDFLVRRGAHFRLSAMKPRLSDLMKSVLRSDRPRPAGILKTVVQFIVDAGCDLSDPDVPSARLLEACGFPMSAFGNTERLEIFESMFRSGARLRPAYQGKGGL